jgi:hypothetical protein
VRGQRCRAVGAVSARGRAGARSARPFPPGSSRERSRRSRGLLRRRRADPPTSGLMRRAGSSKSDLRPSRSRGRPHRLPCAWRQSFRLRFVTVCRRRSHRERRDTGPPCSSPVVRAPWHVEDCSLSVVRGGVVFVARGAPVRDRRPTSVVRCPFNQKPAPLPSASNSSKRNQPYFRAPATHPRETSPTSQPHSRDHRT